MTNRRRHPLSSRPRVDRRRARAAALVAGIAAAWMAGAPRAAEAAAAREAAAPSEAAAQPPGPASVRRFALVIGSNDTLDRRQAPLRFADDDAARIAELLGEYGVEVELLTRFDRESQAVFADAVAKATAPSRDAVLAAHRKLVQRMAAAAAKGARVEYLVYYSGHGDVGPDGQGYLTLAAAGKLDRQALFGELLATSPAQHNHLIIDACRSEALVLGRGGGWRSDRSDADYAKDVTRYLERRHLGAYPNTGVVLATSADQQTHEWERYRGGVFTHELISALRGGADINGDGTLEYSEVGAFVSAANSGVKDPRAHLQVVVRPPPDDERRPLLTDPDVTRRRVLLLQGESDDRVAIEDPRGVRVADVRRAPNQPLYVRLPPGELYVTREPGDGSAAQEAVVGAGRGGVVEAADLEFGPVTRAARGPLDAAFREGLFAVALDRGYYAAYTDQTGILGVREPEWKVTVWTERDGELKEVASASVAAVDGRPEGPVPSAPGVGMALPPPPGAAPPAPVPAPDDDDDDDDDGPRMSIGDDDWRPRAVWGALQAGVVFTPLRPDGVIDGAPWRVTSNPFSGWSGPVRGVDLRWQTFTLHRGKYPRAVGYFRTGTTRGRAEFTPRDPAMGYAPLDPTRLDVWTVPLFVGGNVYAFRSFPLRPYGGLGFGFDVLGLDYRRADGSRRTDVSARIGFELHAGVELRLTNYVALTAEIMQLWSARRRLSGLPDFSNEGFTVLTGLAIGFPLHRFGGSSERGRSRQRPAPEPPPAYPPPPRAIPAPVAPPPAAPAPLAAPANPSPAVAPPAGERVRVRVERGGQAIVIEGELAPASEAPRAAAGSQAAAPAGDAPAVPSDPPAPPRDPRAPALVEVAPPS